MYQLMRRLYLSGFGRWLSSLTKVLVWLHRPRMLYGWKDPETKRFRRHTRVSSSVVVLSPERLSLGDHVWVWHHSIIDATEGVIIHEGAQIGAWVGIFTHGSEKAIRLLGRRFISIPHRERVGYTRGKVEIGEYSFLGAHSVVLPGVSIGKGCLIGAGAVVTKTVPDFSIVVGNPGRIVGSTLKIDAEFVDEPAVAASYFDADVFETLKAEANRVSGRLEEK